ncbi:MAG: hypothetical protein J6Z79_07480 [Clostridia bacterium]|nr:hypothetical protein [Clostridia bacterium]
MSVGAVCAFALLAVFLTVTVKQTEGRLGAILSAAAGVVLWLCAVKELLPMIQALTGLTRDSFAGEAFAALFRALGLALMISFVSGVCRDLGETGTAEKLEFCGKAAMLTLALPLLKRLLSAIVSLLS